jgi:hypothetical protein
MIPAKRFPDNPFASRYVRPGAMPYRFAPGPGAPQLIERLRASGWHGQIVGPHGSGKSSLVTTLIPWLEQAGRVPVLYVLHDGQRCLPSEPVSEHAARGAARPATERAPRETIWTSATQVIVDGYEQLGRLGRWRLHRAVRRAHCGLLATVHAGSSLPELLQLKPEPDTVWKLVESLLAAEAGLFTRDAITDSFARHHGNVREIFCDLYNQYERLRRQHRKES